MKKFIDPEVELIKIQAVDVITTSDDLKLPDVDDGLGWG